jgi:hypothetical protein
MRSKCAPHIASESTETFARRVYAPVGMMCVAVLSLLVTYIAMRIIASLLFFHTGVPSWASAGTTDLWSAGVWGVLALPFSYVVLGSFYGYAQKKEYDLTARPVVHITTLLRALYGVMCRATLHIVAAVAGDTSTACACSQGAHTHLLLSAGARREPHARAPRLRVGRAASAKEAGRVRLSESSTIAIAATGGTRI